MSRRAIRVASVLLCVMLLLALTVSKKISAGTVQDTLRIKNDVPGTVADNFVGIGSGAGGDKLIEIGGKGLTNNPNSLLHGTGYIGGGILKWGGYYIGVYDTTQDTVKIFTETSKHNTTTGKVIDKGLAVVSAGMGWASIIGGAIAIFTVTATAPATGTLLIVTGGTFAIRAAVVGLTRAVINTEMVRTVEDIVSGKKRLVYRPPGVDQSDIDFLKEENGGDPYDRSDNEIPDPNTGIPVYKPNIYIYSSRDIAVNVKLSQYDKITESIPIYNKYNGWKADVFNGSINGSNDYLFYEAVVPDKGFQKEKGWIINGSADGNSLEKDLSSIAELYGFNAKEKKDFLEYWGNKLDSKTGYEVFPQDTTIVDNIMPVNISPSPDNIFRIWFYFSPLCGKTGVTAPDKIKSIQRSDYTVVEWGGLVGPGTN